MFRGEHINVTEDRAVLHVALRMPRERSLIVDGVDVVTEVHESLDRMARLRRARSAAASGAATPASAITQRRQHRHRRLRPRPGDGLRGARATTRDREPDLPLRLQRRRHRLRRGDPRPRPGGDAVHRLLEDLHHAGDDDQRAAPRATGRWPALGGDEAAVAKHFVAVSTNAEAVAEVRHRHRRTCSASGTGSAAATRWTRRSACRPCSRSARTHFREMLAGFHAMDEHFRTRRSSANLPVLMGLLTRLVHRLLRRRDRGGPALRPVPQALPGLPAAADDGVATASTSTLDGEHVDYDTGADLLGRAGHQRPAQLLPADPPGHAADPVRLHRLRPLAQPARRATTTC